MKVLIILIAVYLLTDGARGGRFSYRQSAWPEHPSKPDICPKKKRTSNK